MPARLLLALGVIGVWLFVSGAAVAIHAWNMHGAALECPAGMRVDRGGWAEPDWCSWPEVAQMHIADRDRYSILDPWTSAAVATAVVVAAFAACVRLVAVLCRLAAVRAAVLVLLVSVACAATLSALWVVSTPG